MSLSEVLGRVTDALEAAEIQYMLVGSVAAIYYGYVRNTADLDIVIEAQPQQLQKLISELSEKDYYAQITDALAAWKQRDMFNVIDTATGWKVDFIFLKPRPYAREQFRRRKRSVFEGLSLSFASPEDIILSSWNGRRWANPPGRSRTLLACCRRPRIQSIKRISRIGRMNWV